MAEPSKQLRSALPGGERRWKAPPEYELIAAVIERAINDARHVDCFGKCRFEKWQDGGSCGGKGDGGAYLWLTGEPIRPGRLFDFEALCQHLGLDPDGVRERLKEKPQVPARRVPPPWKVAVGED